MLTPSRHLAPTRTSQQIAKPAVRGLSGGKRLLVFWTIFWGVIVGYFSYTYQIHDPTSRLSYFAVGNFVVSIIALAFLRFALNYRWDSMPMVYFYYFILSHVPVFLFWVFAPEELFLRFNAYQLLWLRGDDNHTAAAAILVFVSLLAFMFGVLVAGARRDDNSDQEATACTAHHPALFWGGMAISLFAIASYVLIISRAGGLVVLFQNYGAFRDDVLNDTFNLGRFLIALGSGFALVGASRQRWYWSLAPFAVVGVSLLMTGNRGEVFFPLLTYLAILPKKGIRLPRTLLIAGVIATLVFIPVINQVRSVGLGSIGNAQVQASWQDPFIEMGYAVRTIVVTYAYVDSGALDFVHGGSYWLPVERQLALVLPFFFERGDVSSDVRNTKIFTPTMGYSPVAEGYYNFGFLGSILFFTLIGFLLGMLDKKSARSHYLLAFCVLILFLLIENVRNSFISIPGRVLLGVALMGAIWFLDGLHTKRRQPWTRRPIRSHTI
jgi:hypothetical protein